MKAKIALYGLIVTAGAGLLGRPAVAQAHTGALDFQVYAGEIFGDHLTRLPLTGRRPELNSSATFGARYAYGLSQFFALELSAGYSPGRAARVAGGGVNLGLTTTDLDILFNVTPALTLGGRRFVLYTEMGIGYAWVDLHHALSGSVSGTPVTLTGRSDYTANVGLGAQYYLMRDFFVDFDARYRFMSGLVEPFGRNMNTAQTTLGLGYRF